VAALKNGNFIITWESDGQDGDNYGIFGQLFSNNGTKEGSEFQVNTYTPNLQRIPSAATLSNGNFVVTWQSYEQDGSSWGVYGQLFSNNGTKQGSEFQVNTYTTNDQSLSSVATLSNGNFVVTWRSQQDGSSSGIYGQLFSNNGTKQGSEFQVNTYTLNNQDSPSVAALSNNNFVVTWQSDGQDGSSYGIYGQIFSSNGMPQGPEFQVNTYTLNDQDSSSVATLSNGNFVVAWQSDGPGNNYGIFSQVFSNNGTKQANEFQVSNYTLNYLQRFPSIAALSNDNFIIAWESAVIQDGSSSGVYGQVFSGNGVKQGTELHISNNYTINIQHGLSIAALSNDSFIVAWESPGQDGSGLGVYSQIFTLVPTPSATSSLTASSTASETPTATLTSSSTGTASKSATSSGTSTATSTNTATESVSPSPTGSITKTSSGTTTGTPTPTASNTASYSGTETGTVSPTTSITTSITSSASMSNSGTGTISSTGSSTGTASKSATSSGTVTTSSTDTATGTASPNPSHTLTPPSSPTICASSPLPTKEDNCCLPCFEQTVTKGDTTITNKLCGNYINGNYSRFFIDNNILNTQNPTPSTYPSELTTTSVSQSANPSISGSFTSSKTTTAKPSKTITTTKTSARDHHHHEDDRNLRQLDKKIDDSNNLYSKSDESIQPNSELHNEQSFLSTITNYLYGLIGGDGELVHEQ
jgi:hypothetical protein